MRIYYSPSFNETDVAFDTTRKAAVVADTLAAHPIPGVTLTAPTAITEDDLRGIHSDRYVKALRTGRPLDLADSNGIGWDKHLWACVTASTGGLVDAALNSLDSGLNSGSLSSGLHHAGRYGGNGFCTINGLAVAAKAAVNAGAGRVLILDLDAHCGGGTAEIIATMPKVEQVDVSVVRFDEYDSRPDALLTLTGPDDYLTMIELELAMIEDPDSIDLVLYNAGVDPHEDAGGVPVITSDMLAEREEIVYEWADAHGLPVAFTLAGGYQSRFYDLYDVAGLHRQTIRSALGV